MLRYPARMRGWIGGIDPGQVRDLKASDASSPTSGTNFEMEYVSDFAYQIHKIRNSTRFFSNYCIQ